MIASRPDRSAGTLVSVAAALSPGALAASLVLDLASARAPRLFVCSFWVVGAGLVAAFSDAVHAVGEALGPPDRLPSFRASASRATLKLAIATLFVVELLLRRGALDRAEPHAVAPFAILSATALALAWLGPLVERMAAGRAITAAAGERVRHRHV